MSVSSFVNRVRAAHSLAISIETGKKPSSAALRHLGLPGDFSSKFVR